MVTVPAPKPHDNTLSSPPLPPSPPPPQQHQPSPHDTLPTTSTALAQLKAGTARAMNPAAPASSANMGPGAPQSQTPGHPSFRRQRASRACETCHARKVRCDAASLGVPCTNCVAFSIECRIPAPKRKKPASKGKDTDSEKGAEESGQDAQPSPGAPLPEEPAPENPRERPGAAAAPPQRSASLGIKEAETYPSEMSNADASTYVSMMKPKFVRAPIKEAGRVAYLGESSNLSLLVHDRYGTTDVVHYPLPENIKGTRARMNELDNVEIDILHQRGAFLLPPRALCDELVEAFFTWVAPVVPVVNRAKFMRRYRDSKNPPSLLLLQAMLLAGSRVCKNPQLMDSNGSTTPAAMTFYKRAKALFDANYEDDRVTIVQALILMGWYWEGPEDVTKNVFYWSRVAIIIAQGSGMHRSVESSQLSKPDKRLWKRIWWTLFTRDRSVAVALGRPCCINTDDSDVEMLTEDDFNDDEIDRPSDFPPDPIHVQFFLNYVKLCEIMGLVLSQQYSVACKVRKHNALDLTHSDMALADWLQNCPREVFWERPRHHFWSALLHSNYYTTLCLLHRAHMPPAGTPTTTVQNGFVVETSYPSRNIAYQAAGMITSIIESLQAHDQLRYTPAFVVYSLFSALIMHVYQMRSSNQAIVSATESRMRTCMTALKEVSKVWLVAKMVHTLFQSILGNKHLEERLQKAAGRRHQKPSRSSNHITPTPKNGVANNSDQQQPLQPGQNKRKYDDIDASFSGQPSHQVSYERSRPQTPAMTPSRELPPSQSNGAAVPADGLESSPPRPPRNDAFMGNSRANTRPTTPFNGNPSYPGTPPDLFLITRNSPTIPQDLWHNFEPGQLFPSEAHVNFPTMSPGGTSQMNSYLEPMNQSQQQQQQQPQPQQTTPQQGQQQLPSNDQQFGGPLPQGMNGMHHRQQQQHQPPPRQGPHGEPVAHHHNDWAQFSAMNQRQGSTGSNNEETWSNSSVSQGPGVPTTLNVEEWFQFFGMSGNSTAMDAFNQSNSSA